MTTHAQLPPDIMRQLESLADNKNAISAQKKEQIKEAIRLYHPRKSTKSIAKVFGVSGNYVCDCIREVKSEICN